MWKRKIFLQLDVKRWKGRRNVHSDGNDECLDHLKSEYQNSSSITVASAHLAGSEAALKWSQVQTDTPALATLLALSHHTPGTSVSIHLPEEQSWDKATGEAQPDPETKVIIFLHDWRSCNTMGLWPMQLLLLRIMQSIGFCFSPGWHLRYFLCFLCSTRWITSKGKTVNCIINKWFKLKCYWFSKSFSCSANKPPCLTEKT